MSQQTNLNVAPYFDDFNANNDYHRVLFKPGAPVQARELTTLQSILQNQIEKFGQHFFKEGAKVIPGNIGYTQLYYCIQLQNTYLGVPVEAYINQLIGVKITGETSGITAVVDKILSSQESERGNLTLYINYLSSSTQNNTTQTFSNGEALITDTAIFSGLLGNTTIAAGQPFAVTTASDASAIGSAFNITNGVYFIRGSFINVESETLILEQYNNRPSYRVGLFINEQIINSDIDETLNDNSQGFNNYSAPGADRLKISVSLFKKNLNDYDDNNFIELTTIEDGKLRTLKTTSEYNLIQDEIARRFHTQFGDSVVVPFDVYIKDSLNNNRGNQGVYQLEQFTSSGLPPSDDLAIYQISPGKAIIRGYEVETISPTFLDIPKTRTTKTLENQAINYNTGPTLSLNRVYGSPKIGIGNNYVLSLRNERVGISQTTAPGREIGVARVYDFKLESGSYNTLNADLNKWNISLYDIQTTVEIKLNEVITLPVPTFVQGKSSGATGFLKNAVTSEELIILYDTAGNFITNESLLFNGISGDRVATAVTSYSISDIKSIYGTVGGGSVFSADTIQSTSFFVGIATISPFEYTSNVNISTISNVSSTVGLGSDIIFVSDTSGVSIGSSVTIGSESEIINADVIGVGPTSITIGSGSTSTNLFKLPIIGSSVGIGSTVLFVEDTSEISIGSSLNIIRPSLLTTISHPVGIGSTQIFVTNVSGVAIGNSISVGVALTDVKVVGLGTTSIFIGVGSTVVSLLTLEINNQVSAGSSQWSLRPGNTLGISTTNTAGVSIGNSFNLIRGELLTTISSPVSSGSTQIFVTNVSGVAIGNSISVGVALTDVKVVGLGTTSITIGAGDTTSSAIGIGTTVTFTLTNYGLSVVGVGSTFITVEAGNTIPVTIADGSVLEFTNASSIIVGSDVTFERINYGLSVVAVGSTSITIGSAGTISEPIGIGTVLEFTDISSLITGTAVTFSNPLFTNTILSPNIAFPGTIKTNNIISFAGQNSQDPFYGKVISVEKTLIRIGDINLPNTEIGIPTIPGICDGQYPTQVTTVADFKVLGTNFESSSDNTLYTKLPKRNISSVDLTNAVLSIRKSFTVNIIGNQLSAAVKAGENETFLPFTEERYLLVRSDGSSEVLTADKFLFMSGGTELQIFSLGDDNNEATLITTLRKIKPKAKQKRKNRINSIIIDKSKYQGSGIGGTTLDDGLKYGNYAFGTRVQDNIISLNVPDVIEIHGIFESAGTGDPSAPKMILSSINGPTSTVDDLIIGEEIISQGVNALGIVAERLSASQISFVPRNQNTFVEGQTVTFRESKIQAVITNLDAPSFDISFNYTFTTGQKGSFYDYASIKRKENAVEPNNKIIIYYASGSYESSDDGDITTVNSYNEFQYGFDLPVVDSSNVSDIIDIRPRVSPYVGFEGARSPLEFFGRSFNSSGGSATNILASKEAILANFSFYLGRIDRIYLTKDGKFQVKYGTPAETPEKPIPVDDALEVSTITLPPYMYSLAASTGGISIQSLDNKVYKNIDIKSLESRIKNLEYYTSLSLLETNTATLFIPDANGLNKFKSGFFVDNFTSLQAQETSIEIKNSIDGRNKELRPSHFTTSVDLVYGPVQNVDPKIDLSTLPVEGINVRKTNDIVTLDYAEVLWLQQTFATRSESVTPFLISFWQGTLELTPASDTWVDQVRMEAKVINTQGNYAEQLALAARTMGVDPQTGLSPTTWGSWVDNWTGSEITESKRTVVTGGDVPKPSWGWGGVPRPTFGTVIGQTVEETLREVKDTGLSTRAGNHTIVTEVFDKTSVGDRTVSRDVIAFMRSRNVQFVSKKLKPLTQIYAFFDNINVTQYCVPKLLEIEMISGVFQVEENVVGKMRSTGLGPMPAAGVNPNIKFRVAQSNHKEGPYNLPTSTFAEDPYTNQVLQPTYSATSKILNVDTFSLSNEPQGSYSGYVASGMQLIGETSGAQAIITNVRLIPDLSSTLKGSFFIPNPNLSVHPKFNTGTKTFTLVNNDQNNQNAASTLAEEGFASSGILETVQENIISVRNARIENKQTFQERSLSRTTGSQVVNSTVIGQTQRQGIIGWYDPLAQSFLIDDEVGLFLTRCDVFFRSKDDMNIPVTFQLRTMVNGYPTQHVIPFSEIIINPDDIQTSGDGSVATAIQFKAPVYLEGGKEYCMCLASNSTKYSVYISRIGENDLLTQTYISNQPYLGSLFKSQNASTWEASQWEDLKFNLYRADFIESGTVEVYNPELSKGNRQIAQLMSNSLNFTSRKVSLNIGSNLNDAGLVIGNTVLQSGTNASGNYVGNAGSASGTLNIINPGIGYTPSIGIQTFTGINLQTITGNGRGAAGSVTIIDGAAASAIITSGGSGYQIGDILGISNIGATNVGINARFSLTSVANINQLILDNVQGDFSVGGGKPVTYVNAGVGTTALNGTNVFVNEIIDETDGSHIKIDHRNHGMYSSDNLVVISGAQSNTVPTKLIIQLVADSTGPISVDNSSAFSTFENIGVGDTNPGYLLIGDEIISYTSVSAGSISGTITRGVDGSKITTHVTATPVYKYELNGISLRRINRQHNLNDVTISNPITYDSYHIKINKSADGINRNTGNNFPVLYANQTKSLGGDNTTATQNIPFEIITPMVHNITVQGTTISAEVRTITGASLSGDEVSFNNAGFAPITLNVPNYLDSTRIIASRVNESNKLSGLRGNRSMNMRLTLSTINRRLSPVLDTQRINAIFTSNRVNKSIDNYVTDSRTNSIDKDPTAFQYISKEITLENPASSIKILLDAYINSYSDIRAFYAVSKSANFNPIFVPFPGYNNITTKGEIVDINSSDGSPDTQITTSISTGFISEDLDYRECTFTGNIQVPFISYRIKLIMTSTSQVYVPRLKNLRVITLA
jgi:hypothetical protein